MARKSLRDVIVPSEKVYLNDEDYFEVEGISFEDIGRLVQAHGPIVVIAYKRFVESQQAAGKATPEGVGGLIVSMLNEFPDALCDLIALAAGTPDEGATVRKLRAPVQLDALHKILALTFQSEGDLKKAVETVTRMVEGLTVGIAALGPTPSVNGSGSFVDR